MGHEPIELLKSNPASSKCEDYLSVHNGYFYLFVKEATGNMNNKSFNSLKWSEEKMGVAPNGTVDLMISLIACSSTFKCRLDLSRRANFEKEVHGRLHLSYPAA